MVKSNIIDKLRQFDAYPKTLEDRIKTYEGAAVTIVSACIMALLFLLELNDYLSPNVTEELFVDTSRSPVMSINLDIIFPTISCEFLALDAMDSSGEQHLMLQHQIYKRRMDLAGNPIEEPKKEEINLKGNEVAVVNKTEKECGSCYGAGFRPDQCCNTCEEVKEAYRQRKWAFPDPQNITQCQNEKYADKLKNAFSEGCQIYGTLTVNRVGGSFHIAPGQSFSINHVHVHDVQPFASTSFNTSHLIKHLSFGHTIDNAKTNPLDESSIIAEEGAMMFQYHIKIVPTAYMRRNGSVILTNQFSVTRHKKVISILNGESGMPGAFFSYELSPLMVKYTERTRSFGHFLTNVCAIIGGVYTVAGLIDSLLYHSIKVIKKKMELGKVN